MSLLRGAPRIPFVVTVAAAGAVTSGACGGRVLIEPTATAAGSGGSVSPKGVTAATAVATASSSSGTGGSDPGCPAELPIWYAGCKLGPEATCSYDVKCQSGWVTLSFGCTGNGWKVKATPCAYPYDSCPGTEFYCSGEWWMPEGTNPPSPCPEPRPKPGDKCWVGGMGGVHPKCGYPCGPDGKSGWTIAHCKVTGANGQQTWQYDGNCLD
jgi:hypothetical protein